MLWFIPLHEWLAIYLSIKLCECLLVSVDLI